MLPPRPPGGTLLGALAVVPPHLHAQLGEISSTPVGMGPQISREAFLTQKLPCSLTGETGRRLCKRGREGANEARGLHKRRFLRKPG